MTALDDIVARKSSMILDIALAKARKDTRQVVEISSQAAALERLIASQLIDDGDLAEAAVNLISAGSCFTDARRMIEARVSFLMAQRISLAPEVKQLAAQYLTALPVGHEPGEVFRTAKASIRGNARLRRPQVEAYDAANRHFADSIEHAIIQLPVGCGKTGTMSLLPFGISKGRALVVAPNLEIARNLRRQFDYAAPTSFLKNTAVLSNGAGPTCAVLDADANVLDTDASDYVVANIQQLISGQGAKWLAQFSPDYFDLVMFDEGHHNAAESWKRIESHFPKAKFTSFTATPLRADGKRVEGRTIYRFPIADAIREGFVKNLAARRLEPTSIEFVYQGSQQRHTLAEVLALREKDWFSKGVALAPECNRSIAAAAIQAMHELRSHSGYRHQIVAAACSIDHANAIRSIFRERGLSAEVLHSGIDSEAQERIRASIESQTLDAIVHVQMLGEGADYRSLSVAAIFRPYRHLVPYVQFVGRIMRVVQQNAPNNADNRGFVVSHVGLHIDRWWQELRELDEGDQLFFESIANSEREFETVSELEDEKRRRFAPDMKVLDEQVERFVQEHFLEADEAKLLVDDLIHAMRLRGIDPEILGVSPEDLAARLGQQSAKTGHVADVIVQPQRARQEARRRLDERVRSGAKQLLNELGMKIGGRNLPSLVPGVQAQTNLPAAIVLLNRAVQDHLQVGPGERDLLTLEQSRAAHDNMDDIIDLVAEQVRAKQTS